MGKVNLCVLRILEKYLLSHSMSTGNVNRQPFSILLLVIGDPGYEPPFPNPLCNLWYRYHVSKPGKGLDG